jgi:capsular polysaccharide biosynthesis protein
LKYDRYRYLREKIAGRFANKPKARFVYLRRGKTGSLRAIENEPEIVEMLSRLGFVVIDVAENSLESLLQGLSNAQVVVSMEGSHLTHCTFSIPSNSGVLVLQPSDRFASVHRGWTMCLGVRFGFVVGSRGQFGYIFSGSEIERTLDLLIKNL